MNTTRMIIAVIGGLVLFGVLATIVDIGQFVVQENDRVNIWCAAEFDELIAGNVSPDSTEMLENYCFLNFEDWKHSSDSYRDGSAEELAISKGTTLSDIVEHNVQRELELSS